MENFIFSINATLPLVLVVCLGVFLKRIGMLDQAFGSKCDRLVFKVTLPVTLFNNLYSIDIRNDFDGKFVGFCAVVTIISIAAVWIGGSAALRKQRDDLGEFVQASYRGSIAILGNALLSNVYGSTAMSPMMLIGSVPLYNIAACLVLALCAPAVIDAEAGRKRSKQLKHAFLGILTNPIILGILAGTLVSLMRLRFPRALETSLKSVASLTTPLSLISIGIGFRGREALGKMDLSCAAAALKLVIIPAVFMPFAVMLGFRGEALIAILIMLGSPTTPSSYTMAKSYGYDGTVSASVVVLTMLGSAVSITLGILILRTLGFV